MTPDTKDRLAGEGLRVQQRRVVQIAAAFDAGDGCGGVSSSYQPTVCLYALCNDGTLWVQARGQWIDLPPIPQPDEPHNHAHNTVGADPDREQRIRELVETLREAGAALRANALRHDPSLSHEEINGHPLMQRIEAALASAEEYLK